MQRIVEQIENVVMYSQKIYFKGQCPVCGKQQTSEVEQNVDILCKRCKEKEKTKQTYENNKFIIDSKIVGFDLVDNDIVSIHLITTNGRRYEISVDLGQLDVVPSNYMSTTEEWSL